MTKINTNSPVVSPSSPATKNSPAASTAAINPYLSQKIRKTNAFVASFRLYREGFYNLKAAYKGELSASKQKQAGVEGKLKWQMRIKLVLSSALFFLSPPLLSAFPLFLFKKNGECQFTIKIEKPVEEQGPKSAEKTPVDPTHVTGQTEETTTTSHEELKKADAGQKSETANQHVEPLPLEINQNALAFLLTRMGLDPRNSLVDNTQRPQQELPVPSTQYPVTVVPQASVVLPEGVSMEMLMQFYNLLFPANQELQQQESQPGQIVPLVDHVPLAPPSLHDFLRMQIKFTPVQLKYLNAFLEQNRARSEIVELGLDGKPLNSVEPPKTAADEQVEPAADAPSQDNKLIVGGALLTVGTLLALAARNRSLISAFFSN